MALYHTGLFVACEEPGCKTNEIFENPAGQSDYTLECKATMHQGRQGDNWYLSLTGKRLCKMHQQALATKLGLFKKDGTPSMYVEMVSAGVPIKKDEASKSAKKRAKEGAD